MKNLNELIVRMNRVIEVSNKNNGEEYDVVINNWTSDNGKSRTYLKVSCKEGRKYSSKDYGYFDNVKNEYVPGKFDLTANKVCDFGGNHVVEF